LLWLVAGSILGEVPDPIWLNEGSQSRWAGAFSSAFHCS
jgi:hypothetical protein